MDVWGGQGVSSGSCGPRAELGREVEGLTQPSHLVRPNRQEMCVFVYSTCESCCWRAIGFECVLICVLSNEEHGRAAARRSATIIIIRALFFNKIEFWVLLLLSLCVVYIFPPRLDLRPRILYISIRCSLCSLWRRSSLYLYLYLYLSSTRGRFNLRAEH